MLLTITLAQAAKHPKNTKKIIPTFHIMMLGKKTMLSKLSHTSGLKCNGINDMLLKLI